MAGDAAVGVYITTPTPPYDGLTDRGKALMRRLAAASSGAAVDPWAPLAAQATEVLLEAIARSDGTRDSVSDELLETNVGTASCGRSRSTRMATLRPPASQSCA